ncbi:TetR/AcrR family transcriptional regulator [Paenibacillus sp. GCM10012306]|uniref:TetR/AcrR family transcriptional regulator n=1 Tax=Paenibacillus sp. GCM10012306 TaxID=3317342 RepID=UPI00361FF764
MVRQREFDEGKALDAAMRVFWEKGFEASSLNDLTSEMGIQRPSLYAAFGDKKQLFETALRKYTQLHASGIRAKLQKGTTVKESFCFLLEGIVEEEYAEGPSKGCFCINTMVELAPHDEKFEILTREHQMYLAAIFQERIEQGVHAGELAGDTNIKALAQGLVITLIGLTVMMKARPERSFADNAIQMALTMIK